VRKRHQLEQSIGSVALSVPQDVFTLHPEAQFLHRPETSGTL